MYWTWYMVLTLHNTQAHWHSIQKCQKVQNGKPKLMWVTFCKKNDQWLHVFYYHYVLMQSIYIVSIVRATFLFAVLRFFCTFFSRKIQMWIYQGEVFERNNIEFHIWKQRYDIRLPEVIGDWKELSKKKMFGKKSELKKKNF